MSNKLFKGYEKLAISEKNKIEESFLKKQGHKVFYQRYGNPKGEPFFAIHGGEGYVFEPEKIDFFNPQTQHIIFIHQRGFGKSKPLGKEKNNQTNELIKDIDVIRKKLGLKKINLFGWSWGSALSLLYAQKHPKKTKSITVFGAYSATNKEIDDSFFHKGKQTQKLVSFMKTDNREQILNIFHKKLKSKNKNQQLSYLYQYEKLYNSQIVPFREFIKQDEKTLEKRIKNVCLYINYMKNSYYIKDEQIIKNAHKIANTPVNIINGINDTSTKYLNAIRLNKAFRKSNLTLIPYTGHNLYDKKAQNIIKLKLNNLTPTSKYVANDNNKNRFPINSFSKNKQR